MNVRLLPYTPERDVYRLLGVAPTASSDEITLACRRLARTFHPDRNASRRATEEMQVINAVRQALSDPQVRLLYDRERHRFHARLSGRSRTPSGVAPSMTIQPRRRRRPLVRYAVATALGVKATVIALAPPRCARCRAVIPSEDAYCAGCGTPLLSGG